MINVPEEEIRKRMQKLHNYDKVLYPRLKERSDKVRKENKQLKEENEKLKNMNKKKDKAIEKLQLELEELRVMKFGKKQKEKQKEKVCLPGKGRRKGEYSEEKRDPGSYRRKEPKEEEVTGEIRIAIDECPKCNGELTKKDEYEYYREDLEELNILMQNAKKVTKRIIESGYCPHCKKRRSNVDIPKQKVEIGLNIKMMIVYYMVVLGLSYKEIQDHLKTQYNIEVSEGQIAKSLEEQADILRPVYREIFEELQKEKGCHYDETSWKTGSQGKEISEGNYAWVKTGVESDNVIFWFGKSRGKGVAEKLRGDIAQETVRNQIGISDDYGSYRNIFSKHQLCWSHPHRKLRDLAESTVLDESVRKHCEKVYKDFAKLYKEAEKTKEKFHSGGYEHETEKKKDEERLKKLLQKITVPDKKDPDKLRCIKESLKERLDRYFTFLTVPGIPLDNNKAERSLRKVVLKRKKSFGCKSQKGANTLSILYSVVFTIISTHPHEEFFEHYLKALDI